MVRRLAAALAFAHALLACEEVLGIGELTVVSDGADADAPPIESDTDAGSDADTTPGRSDAADAGDDVGPPKKRVFVTANMSTGILGGRKGADAQCAAAAATGKLSGAWIAWLSQGGEPIPNAVDRIPHDGPFYRLDDVLVAENKAQLTNGTLIAPIITTETGALLTSPTIEEARVWTGTVSSGIFRADCNKWSSANSLEFGTMGSLTYITNGIWTNNGGPGPGFPDWGCQTRGRLYCFEL